MSNIFPNTIFCVFNWAIIVVILLRCCFTPFFRNPIREPIAFLIVAALLIAPLYGSPLIFYPRSLWGDFSMSTTCLILFLFFQKHTVKSHPKKQLMYCALIIILSGLVLYPATLGLSLLDPYQWGYSPRNMVVLTATLTMVSWVINQWLLACMLTSATLAFNLELLESSNYWDYLIDPALFIASVGFILFRALAHITRSRGHI